MSKHYFMVELHSKYPFGYKLPERNEKSFAHVVHVIFFGFCYLDHQQVIFFYSTYTFFSLTPFCPIIIQLWPKAVLSVNIKPISWAQTELKMFVFIFLAVIFWFHEALRPIWNIKPPAGKLVGGTYNIDLFFCPFKETCTINIRW